MLWPLSLFIFGLTSALDTDYELIFVNTIWRHGDRAPEAQMPAGLDKVRDDDWKQGGGGLGQLTTVGMKQHFKLGRLLRKRYIDSGFLSPRYRANEIYIRSTDYNRTLVSAYSNLNGMYSRPSINLDSIFRRHQIGSPADSRTHGHSVANGETNCKRLSQLRSLILNSTECRAYKADPQIAAVIDYVDKIAGQKLDDTRRAFIIDAIKVEGTHFAEFPNIPGKNIVEWHDLQLYPWFFAHDIYVWIARMTVKMLHFHPLGINGIDVHKEVTKLRGGEMINNILSHVHGVLDCLNPGSKACAHFFKKLKYFAISTHDVSLTAYLDVFGARLRVLGEDNPKYASAMATEFYRKKSTGEVFFKVFSNPGEDADFSPITTFISGCPIDQDFCPFSVFEALAKTYDTVDIVKLCNTDL